MKIGFYRPFFFIKRKAWKFLQVANRSDASTISRDFSKVAKNEDLKVMDFEWKSRKDFYKWKYEHSCKRIKFFF